MTKQKSPHTQTQQNVTPEQTDLEVDEREYEADADADQEIYNNMEGAETGENRSPRKIQTRSEQHNTEPETEAHEGSVTSRTPKRPAQGITSHTEEESSRQKKVVGERPDAQAGVNHSRKR
jgi:hypothetical protein